MSSRFAGVVAIGLALGAVDALAQTYPTKPIRVIVPFVAGGSYDAIMRVVGESLGEALKQQVVVENRGGASGMIGGEILARATPDGYTLGMLGDNHSVLAATGRKTPYDLFKDFAPIMRVASVDYVVVVHSSMPARSLRELIALLKANPGKYNYGSGGTAGTTHLAGARFSQLTGVNIVHVPYKGGGLAVTGLAGNEVQLMILNMISARPQVQAGMIRALAVAARKRSAYLPKVPTTAEAGLPGYEVSQFYGMFAPVKTPKRILARIENELTRIMSSAAVKKKIEAQGADPYSETPVQLAAFLKENVTLYRESAQAAGIRGQ
ncbi:MAG: tripartite tricarboxylate transporter substrate binding protein [Betaproteobacteria bacterium]|nr:tripartite tricarboxylate transporter substrate binding protein [Betaproteobacteria bacterium]